MSSSADAAAREAAARTMLAEFKDELGQLDEDAVKLRATASLLEKSFFEIELLENVIQRDKHAFGSQFDTAYQTNIDKKLQKLETRIREAAVLLRTEEKQAMQRVLEKTRSLVADLERLNNIARELRKFDAA